jgi:hypothetical protein
LPSGELLEKGVTTMKRALAYVLGAAAAMAVASSAQAAQYLTLTGQSGVFGDDAVGAGDFTRTFTFDVPTGFTLTSLTITSAATSDPATNLDFFEVTFNGEAFNIGSTGDVEFRSLLNRPVLTTGNTIFVRGTSGADSSFSGTITLANTGGGNAIPEPASWALMLAGFAAAGLGVRSRRTGTRAASA